MISSELGGVMRQAAKLMERKEGEEIERENEKKCFWLPDSRWNELFMCVFMRKLSPIFLFHYDRRNKMGQEERLNQVTEIDYSGPTKATMKFKNGKSANMNYTLKISLAWLRKWETIFTPEKNCKINKKENNLKGYTLTCEAESKKSVKLNWIRDVNPESV